MTLLEAMKTGKRFKRESYPPGAKWHEPVKTYDQFTGRVDDLLADDWIVEEKSATVTRSQVLTAISNAAKKIMAARAPFNNYSLAEGTYLHGSLDILRELGLEE